MFQSTGVEKVQSDHHTTKQTQTTSPELLNILSIIFSEAVLCSSAYPIDVLSEHHLPIVARDKKILNARHSSAVISSRSTFFNTTRIRKNPGHSGQLRSWINSPNPQLFPNTRASLRWVDERLRLKLSRMTGTVLCKWFSYCAKFETNSNCYIAPFLSEREVCLRRHMSFPYCARSMSR